jgi:hypothetical protein
MSIIGGQLELCVQVPSFTVVPPSVKIVGKPKNYIIKQQQRILRSSAFNVLSYIIPMRERGKAPTPLKGAKN